jgi:hypothetical protein
LLRTSVEADYRGAAVAGIQTLRAEWHAHVDECPAVSTRH